MRLGYWACAAAVNASHPNRNRNTAGAIEVVPLRILAPCRNQYAMLRADFVEPCLREKREARVDFAAGGNDMNRGFGAAVAVLFALHVALAHAQEAWPARPVKFIVPSSPGGVVAPLVICVHPSVPARTLGELVALGRREPGKLSFGSAGTGSPTYLGIRMLEEASGAKFLHVPFKGIGNMMPSLLGGQLDFAFPDAAVALPHIRAGKLMPLAVIVRTNALPKVPTLAEAGFPGLEIYSSFSVVAPSGTPPAIVQRMSAEIIRAMRSPGLAEKLEHETLIPVFDTPELFAAHLKKERAAWEAVIRRSAIVPD